ncbi:MAG: helix-turn-helix domain-containing protein, partial [Myxococcota bacterium]
PAERVSGIFEVPILAEDTFGPSAGDEARTGPARAASAGGGVTLPHDLTLDEVSRMYAAAAVDRADGNRSAAARVLGIGRNKLARLLRPAGGDSDGE